MEIDNFVLMTDDIGTWLEKAVCPWAKTVFATNALVYSNKLHFYWSSQNPLVVSMFKTLTDVHKLQKIVLNRISVLSYDMQLQLKSMIQSFII